MRWIQTRGVIGFILGVIVSHIIGFFSLYELLASFLDKPFFQTHGAWMFSFVLFSIIALGVTRLMLKSNNECNRMLLQAAIMELKGEAKPKRQPVKKGGERK